MKFPWPLSMTAPLIAVATTVCLLALILSTNLGGYGVGNVFAYHPALMTVGFCFFMPLGLLGYVYDLGSAGNAVYSGRTQRRVLHGIFMMCASCCILTAYLAAFVYHQARGIDHLALNMPEKTRPAHVFLGFIALAGVVLNSIVGMMKYVTLTKDGVPTARWHGMVGPAVWIIGLVCIGLAGWFEYQEGPGHWTLGQAVAIWVLLIALAASVLLHLYKGNRDHVNDNSADMESVSASKASRLLIQ